MSRLSHLFFLISVLAILTLGGLIPLGLWAAGAERSFSETENRSLSSFSDVVKAKEGFRDVTSRIESATSDQLPMRDSIVRHFRRFQVYGFGHETNEAVLIGRNGHWYQTGSKVISRMPCASPSPVVGKFQEGFSDGIISLSNWLRDEGKSLSVIIVPLQHSLEPSNLPGKLAEKCQDPFKPLQDSIRKLRAANVDLLYDPDWMIETGVEQFYDRRAFHWNPAGALRYSRHGIESGAFPTADFNMTKFSPNSRSRETDVDIGRYLGVAPLAQTYEEPIVLETFEFKGPVIRAIRQELIPKDVLKNYRGRRAGGAYYTETDNDANGKGLIIGDSFSNAAFEFWARQFSSALSATTNNLKSDPGQFQNLISDFDPDHVVLIFEESKFTPVKGGPTWRTVANSLGEPKE